MNIVQVSGGELRIPAEAGAVEAIILDLSKELVKLGHNVTILDRKYSKEDSDFEYLHGIKIVRLYTKKFTGAWARNKFAYSFKMALNQFLFSLQVRRYLSGAKSVDIIHTHTSIIGLTLALLGRNFRGKLIYTSHTARRLMDSPGFFDRLALLPENKLPQRIERTIALNERARKKLLLAAGVRAEAVVTIPFGLDVSKYSHTCHGEGTRQRYGLNGKSVILFVGVINERKGVEYLVKAANIVVNEFGYKDVFFLLVGPIGAFELKENTQTEYVARILSFIENHGLKQNTKLTGLLPKDELENLYAACDIFVLPTLAEALPRVVLEAMACGKPVIATRVGGIPTQVKDGQSGFLIDPANEKQLAERIKYLLHNPREAEKMGARGRKFAEEEFDSSKMAQRLLQVYQSVLQQARASRRTGWIATRKEWQKSC